MNILTHLQELDKLIIEHTQPKVTAILRDKLSFALEQAEAHSDAVAKQEKTLATQMETIDRLLKENQQLIAKEESANRGASDALKKKSDDYHRMLRSKELRYDV